MSDLSLLLNGRLFGHLLADNLRKWGEYRDEINELYRALFRNAGPHIEVVTALASKGKGMTRKDDTVNICEMKYAKDKFTIDKEYSGKLENKLNVFAEETATKKSLILTMITTCGIEKNMYSDTVQAEITLDELFKG